MSIDSLTVHDAVRDTRQHGVYIDASALAAPGAHPLSAGLRRPAQGNCSGLLCTGTIQCVRVCVCTCVSRTMSHTNMLPM